MRGLYLGLMSGTSMNGVDAAVVRFVDGRLEGIVGCDRVAYPAALRQKLLHLVRAKPALTVGELCGLDHAVARLFADAALKALHSAGAAPESIVAVGSHGQTIHHLPRGETPCSLQIGDPSLISALTGLTVVADFRRRDIALGGQGAPLVPAFHHALFATPGETRVVLNVGGIANITVLPGTDATAVRGFDTGPGNGLMDEWSHRHLGTEHDDGGRFAAQGTADEALVGALLADPYFDQPPPKSSGRDHFHLDWAEARFPALHSLPPAAVQRSFCAVTARSVAAAVRRHAPATSRLLVCGGGAHNRTLMDDLRTATGLPVETTGDHGLHVDWVEAAAFAWLAMRTLEGLPGNLPAVTGARAPAILGGIYRA